MVPLVRVGSGDDHSSIWRLCDSCDSEQHWRLARGLGSGRELVYVGWARAEADSGPAIDREACASAHSYESPRRAPPKLGQRRRLASSRCCWGLRTTVRYRPWSDRTATSWQLIVGYGNRHPSDTARRNAGRQGGGLETRVRRQTLPCFVGSRRLHGRFGAERRFAPHPTCELPSYGPGRQYVSGGARLPRGSGRAPRRQPGRWQARRPWPRPYRRGRDPSPFDWDDRQSARHRLANDVPEVLGARGKDGRIRRGQGSRKGLANKVSGEEAILARPLAQFLSGWTLPPNTRQIEGPTLWTTSSRFASARRVT